MIARVWTARAARRNVEAYRQHLHDRVLPVLEAVPGYRGGKLLERGDAGAVEIVVITWWRSLDDVRRFSGPDVERAVVADDAAALLERFDQTVRHFDVTVDTSASE